MPRRTILVVEDQDILRSTLVEVIRGRGYEVIECGDGNSAKDVLDSESEIDLLLSDIRLPGMNGFRLAEIALSRWPALKILLMTGFTPDPVPESLCAAGITILYKPFSIDELLRKISSML
jgi:CheY-like chemotaxis protein